MIKDRPPPPLNYIRSFECAARHLSFTAAAAELGFTQAAISMHVRSLEKYVGRPLFIRYARSLKLTETGEAFLPTLRQGLRQIDMATETIVSSSRSQTVIVAAPMSFAENWLTKCLSGFHASYPEIEVVVHGTVWDAEIDSIADITISINRDDDAPLGSQLLTSERVAMLCAPKLLDVISEPDDIRTLPKIYVLGRQDYWDLFTRSLGLENVEHDRGYRANASNIALEMAANGMGLVTSLVSLSQAYVDRGLLVEPFATRSGSTWGYYIKAPERSKSGPDAKLLEWIVAHAKQPGEAPRR